MVVVYPVLLEYDEDDQCYLVEVPDLEIHTYGDSISDAIYMARDAIGLICIDKTECGESLPQPSSLSDCSQTENRIATLVDVDLTVCKALYGSQPVEIKVHLPQWIITHAQQKNINLSLVLEEALKARFTDED